MAARIIQLRYTGTCAVCGCTLARRAHAHWDESTRSVVCLVCEPVIGTEGSAGGASAAPELARPSAGQAGASAAYEYQRRHDRHQEALERRYGPFAGVVDFLAGEPQSTRAWATGAGGERQVAEELTRRLGDRAVLLHDRKIPGSRANIDHLVVAASGVWVIDAKKYQGRVKRVDKGGLFLTDLRLYVGGTRPDPPRRGPPPAGGDRPGGRRQRRAARPQDPLLRRRRVGPLPEALPDRGGVGRLPQEARRAHRRAGPALRGRDAPRRQRPREGPPAEGRVARPNAARPQQLFAESEHSAASVGDVEGGIVTFSDGARS